MHSSPSKRGPGQNVVPVEPEPCDPECDDVDGGGGGECVIDDECNDATGVPRNPALLVANADLAFAGLELRRGGTGEEVATTFDLVEGQFDNFPRVWMGQPDQLLDAGASYEIWATPESLGDAFAISDFTVGDLVDTTAPAAPALTAMTATHWVGGESCDGAACWPGSGTIESFVVEHDATEPLGYGIVELRRADSAESVATILRRSFRERHDRSVHGPLL